MKTQTQKNTDVINIPREKFTSLINQLLGGPQPIPWSSPESVLRQDRLEFFAHFNSYIWELIGGWGKFNSAELNPQPIPPRAAFLTAFTHEAIDRILLIQEVADAVNQTNGEKSKIVVSDRISQFVDDWCGTKPRFKFPIPHPKWDEKLSGVELLTAGAIFAQTAKNVDGRELQNELQNAADKLIETGVARM